jgi:hypothetical protein
VQTAHDAPYLVKHLLYGLPPVQQRVAEMRAGRGPGPASHAQAAAEMEESQVPATGHVMNDRNPAVSMTSQPTLFRMSSAKTVLHDSYDPPHCLKLPAVFSVLMIRTGGENIRVDLFCWRFIVMSSPLCR